MAKFFQFSKPDGSVIRINIEQICTIAESPTVSGVEIAMADGALHQLKGTPAVEFIAEMDGWEITGKKPATA